MRRRAFVGRLTRTAALRAPRDYLSLSLERTADADCVVPREHSYSVPRAVFFFFFSQTKYLCILFRYIFKVARRFLFCLIDSAARCIDRTQTKEYLEPAARCGNTLLTCAHRVLYIVITARAVFRHSQ